MDPIEAGRKRIWWILWAAFTVAPIVYYFVGTQVVTAGPTAAPLARFRVVFVLLSALLGGEGAFLMTRAPRAREGATGMAALFGGSDLAAPADFQRAFIVATALVESCSVLGFVLICMGAPLHEYLLFGLETFGLMVAVGLPTGLRYWRERATADATGGPIGG